MAMSEYTNLGYRYKSFDFINHPISPFPMASDGLYLEQKGERFTIRCAFCLFELDSLYIENCRVSHMMSNPYCIQLCTSHGLKKISQFLMACNVIVWQYEIVRRNLVTHFIGPMLEKVPSVNKSSNVEFSWPTNMEMADFSERRISLNCMGSQTHHSLDDIADAGFYNDTNAFVLMCYYCGEHVDIHDCGEHVDIHDCGEHVDIHDLNKYPDPWRAHLSASWKCFHNILMRGDDFILLDKLDSGVNSHTDKGIKRRRNHEQANQGASYQNNAPKKMKTSTTEVPACYLDPVPQEREKTCQGCSCSQRKGNGCKHRQHQTCSRTKNHSPYRPYESCDGPHTCFKCKVSAGKPDLVLTLCCHVWVCLECAMIEQCPKCYKSNCEVSGLNNRMECD